MPKTSKEEKHCLSGRGLKEADAGALPWAPAPEDTAAEHRVCFHYSCALCSVTAAGVPVSRQRPRGGGWRGEQHDVFPVYPCSELLFSKGLNGT